MNIGMDRISGHYSCVTKEEIERMKKRLEGLEFVLNFLAENNHSNEVNIVMGQLVRDMLYTKRTLLESTKKKKV